MPAFLQLAKQIFISFAFTFYIIYVSPNNNKKYQLSKPSKNSVLLDLRIKVRNNETERIYANDMDDPFALILGKVTVIFSARDFALTAAIWKGKRHWGKTGIVL